MHWTLLTDIFHYMRGKSMTHYPYIDVKTLKEHFIDDLDPTNDSISVLSDLKNLVVEACTQSKLAKDGKAHRTPDDYVINRSLLLEI